MAILGITNRTENWKTAAYFAPLFGYGSTRLAKRLGENGNVRPGDVSLELFWSGVRDYFHLRGQKLETEHGTLADAYSHLFPNLRQKIERFGGSEGFQALTDSNYSASTDDQRAKLASNLFHTEIDIVLESPSHFFIGEAKHLSTFGANSDDILTHQLVRQYVMARVLLRLLGRKQYLVPFVVGNSSADLTKSRQVQFMVNEGWLREENILEWRDVADAAYPTPD